MQPASATNALTLASLPGRACCPQRAVCDVGLLQSGALNNIGQRLSFSRRFFAAWNLIARTAGWGQPALPFGFGSAALRTARPTIGALFVSILAVAFLHTVSAGEAPETGGKLKIVRIDPPEKEFFSKRLD